MTCEIVCFKLNFITILSKTEPIKIHLALKINFNLKITLEKIITATIENNY